MVDEIKIATAGNGWIISALYGFVDGEKSMVVTKQAVSLGPIELGLTSSGFKGRIILDEVVKSE